MTVGVRDRSKLDMLARRMLDRVRTGQRPWAYEALPHGLELLLQRKEGGFRLAIARVAPTRPSDTEEAVLRKAFGVPSWAESERVASMRNDVLRNVISIEWNAAGEG